MCLAWRAAQDDSGFSDISPEKQRELERIAYVDTVTGGNNYESFKKEAA